MEIENKKPKLHKFYWKKKFIILIILILFFWIGKTLVNSKKESFVVTRQEKYSHFLRINLPSKNVRKDDCNVKVEYGHGFENIDENSPYYNLECFIEINLSSSTGFKSITDRILLYEENLGTFFKDERSYVKYKTQYIWIYPAWTKYGTFQLNFEKIIDFKKIELGAGNLEFRIRCKGDESIFTLVDSIIGFEIKGDYVIFTA